MKKTLFIICLLIGFQSFAQRNPKPGNCKYIKNDIDDFTKEIWKETGFYQYSKTEFPTTKYLNVQAVQQGENIFLKLAVNVVSRAFSISKGNKIHFLTEEDEIITLLAPSYESSDHSTLAGSSIFTSIISLHLTEENLTNFVNKRIKKIRVESNNGLIDFDVAKKSKDNIKILLDCLEN